ncbi:MAG: TetR/AcrR family transcriptional regulator [Gammaproteobacteria bacterium]|nr:TetR/AcrR family transcriptional regulator [Gammaproteobacteria bacterium]MBU2676774.1 TetR/AcrR family transcriptional regulator [Gammaproteobacteria bacterium]NNL50508.1 TetR family transcriptional regulator [Woeseiaceae bacterium]
MSRDTRTRILVASLLLFNENGEPNTTTNDIADEVDISPGNLHYHFRKKSDLVDALLLEFQADAKRVLQPPESSQASLDDFWVFLHHLLELTASYRFLLRDMESLVVDYAKLGNALKHFARGLVASFELYLHALAAGGQIGLDSRDMRIVSRNLAVIALFSEKFDSLVDSSSTVDDSALRIAAAVLNVLRPYVTEEHSGHLAELATYYAA